MGNLKSEYCCITKLNSYFYDVVLSATDGTCEKWSAALSISAFARATSSFRPVTTKTGSSPRTGVFMYVLVLALKAFILQPKMEIYIYYWNKDFVQRFL